MDYRLDGGGELEGRYGGGGNIGGQAGCLRKNGRTGGGADGELNKRRVVEGKLEDRVGGGGKIDKVVEIL